MKTAAYQTVLCIAAHPDDEVLGVGGTLALHALNGDRIVVVILSEGEREKGEQNPACPGRRECARQAAAVLGTGQVIFHDFPDQRLGKVRTPVLVAGDRLQGSEEDELADIVQQPAAIGLVG